MFSLGIKRKRGLWNKHRRKGIAFALCLVAVSQLGPAGKTAVVGIKNRDTNQIKAQVVESKDKTTLQGFVLDNTTADTVIYTDENRAYSGLLREHQTVGHGVGEYVREQGHTNGLESFWAMLIGRIAPSPVEKKGL